MDTLSVKLKNDLVVTVDANDPAIVDDIIPRYEVRATLDGNPLLDPKTRKPIFYGVWDDADMVPIMDHFAAMEVGRLRLVK